MYMHGNVIICIDTFNKIFFSKQKAGCKSGPVWELVPKSRGGNIKKECRKVNV
jgi:hypothetical protein